MPNILNPKPVTTRKFLKRDLIHVPQYQRSYSWEKEQVTEFLDDFKNSCEAGESWFLGIVYTHEFGPDRSYLLDGQQRLTTLFILIKELLLFHENTQGEAEADFKALATEELRHLIIEAGASRIKLDTATGTEFSNYVLSDSFKTARIGYDVNGDFALPHKLLDRAIKQIRDWLPTLLQTDGFDDFDFDKFQNVIAFVLDKIELIEIELASTAAFHRIFENINDRGLHLTDSDKFKNLYCSLTPDIDLFEKEWFEVSKLVFSVGKNLEDDLVDFYYRSVGVEYEKDAKGFYATVRKELQGKGDPQKLHEVTAIFKSLKEMARILRAIERYDLESTFSGNCTDKINKASKITTVLVKATWSKFKQFGVLVFACFLNYRDRGDKDAFARFLTDLYNAARFYMAADLAGIQANEIRKNTVTIASHLAQGMPVADAIEKSKLNYSTDLLPDKLEWLRFADNKKTSIVLLLIQAEKNPALIHQYDPKHKWSLEHLLPKEWEEHWPGAAKVDWDELNKKYSPQLAKPLTKEDLTEENRHRVQEFLGNKLYYSLGENVLGSNRSLDFKQNQIRESVSPVILPATEDVPGVPDYYTFGIAEILDRTKVLGPQLINALKSRTLPGGLF